MRAIFLLSLLLAGGGALAACSYSHPGPNVASAENALPEETPPAKPRATQKADKPLALEPVSANGGGSESIPPSPPKVRAKTKPDLVSEMAGSDDDPPPMVQGESSGRGGINAGMEGDNIDVIDDSLNGQLAVVRVGSETTSNNLLAVFAGLKNKTAQKLYLEVQTIYKDKDGNSLNTGSWVPMTLKPHQETEYRSASLSEEAADYLVRVRRAP